MNKTIESAPLHSRLTIRAPAKINLNLHIAGKRPDGYHELSGLVAFADYGDELEVELASFEADEGRASDKEDAGGRSDWALDVQGPFADALIGEGPPCRDNLVLNAARLFNTYSGLNYRGSIRLRKNLPIASGMGGGSSDAAAMLRALQSLCATPIDEDQLQKLALEIGADVPMCLRPKAQFISGVGEIYHFLPLPAPLPAVLVNPILAVSTREVFGRLNASPCSSASVQVPTFSSIKELYQWLLQQRNDLQSPALELVPRIGDVLDIIAKTPNCLLARMSGSGASCFGLYADIEQAKRAASIIGEANPNWWVMPCLLE